jgi:hypothetical protein
MMTMTIITAITTFMTMATMVGRMTSVNISMSPTTNETKTGQSSLLTLFPLSTPCLVGISR